MADADSSGVIESNEHTQLIKQLDLSEKLKTSLAENFSSIDEDGSGGITLNEFIQFFYKFPSFKQELLMLSTNNAPYVNEKGLS